MKFPFLALLASGPAHGYELKQALEQRFGAALAPLNAGQVYTTLARLERDGLVRGADVRGDNRNKRTYELTDTGRAALDEWLETPAPPARARDTFFLKLLLSERPRRLIEHQRREYLQALRALTEAGRSDGDVAALLAEGTALHLEADLRWLDLCEERLTKEENP